MDQYPYPVTGSYHNPGHSVPPLMGFGTVQQQQQQGQAQKIDPVIGGLGGWMHIGLGAALGLGAGWFLFR